jgi:hypothetical protein
MVNVKVAYATHEPPFSPCGRKAGKEGKAVMTFMIWGVSTVMTVKVKVAIRERELAHARAARLADLSQLVIAPVTICHSLRRSAVRG